MSSTQSKDGKALKIEK